MDVYIRWSFKVRNSGVNAWWKSKDISGLYKVITVSVMLTSSLGYPRVANKKAQVIAKAGSLCARVHFLHLQRWCSFFLLFSFTDNELMYRTRDGDVVKLNVDTKHTTVVVPNQLFVSVLCLRGSLLSTAAIMSVLWLQVCVWSRPGKIQSC